MSESNNGRPALIQVEKIREMLFHEEKYVSEFAAASIESFSEFRQSYERLLPERDLEQLRKAGHKIKPVARLLNLEELISEHYRAKQLLAEDGTDEELRRSVTKVSELCERVIGEFREILRQTGSGSGAGTDAENQSE